MVVGVVGGDGGGWDVVVDGVVYGNGVVGGAGVVMTDVVVGGDSDVDGVIAVHYGVATADVVVGVVIIHIDGCLMLSVVLWWVW